MHYQKERGKKGSLGKTKFIYPWKNYIFKFKIDA